MNRIDELFSRKNRNVLNVYCTAGFPAPGSTVEVITSLSDNGADIIEIGMPYSDPLADGPVIQQSNMVALENGMTIEGLFEQLKDIRKKTAVPLILMGYLNPVLQFGMERFCEMAARVGVDGCIIPDLPIYEYTHFYKSLFEQHGLHFIFLVTPETSEERIRVIDQLSGGFIYAVSSSSTTGNNAAIESQEGYFNKLRNLRLKNPVLVGFGIRDKSGFEAACRHTNGAIIGTAYIRAIEKSRNLAETTKEFLNSILG